jgi:hypothetical protein
MKDNKLDLKNTISTLCKAIEVYDETYQSFQNNPSGEMYKELEFRRLDLVDTCRVCYHLTFPDAASADEKEAIQIGMAILQERRKQDHQGDSKGL